MSRPAASGRVSSTGRVIAHRPVAAGLYLTTLELPGPLAFEPGQFAMLNFTGRDQLVFSRPFSLHAGEGPRVSFLYRVVGAGTAMLASLSPGQSLTFFGPLGSPFPAPLPERPHLLIAGGCGLPPLHAWMQRYGRDVDRAFFGGKDGSEVPWGLLDASWRISVDHRHDIPADRQAFTGLVVDHCRASLSEPGPERWTVFACGPKPMLQAAVELAAERGWTCFVSVEERMGCGYGVCRGCVIPASGGGHLTACQDGPVLAAERIDWERFLQATPASGPQPHVCHRTAGEEDSIA